MGKTHSTNYFYRPSQRQYNGPSVIAVTTKPFMTHSTPSLDVAIAAYNEPAFTAATLEGYANQTDMDFTLLVADDGSKDDIRHLVERYKGRVNIKYFYQEDIGFRKAKILNTAVSHSTADYLVFSDNDCIPSRYFIEDHKKAATPGFFVSGRRIDCQNRELNQLFFNLADYSNLPFDHAGWLIKNTISKNIRYAESAIRFPHWLHQLWSKKRKPLLGANMAMWRTDFLQAGQFDESFNTYGGEETDLENRLLTRTQAKLKTVRGRAYVFHFYHKSRAQTP